jgi:hypothetical protein
VANFLKARGAWDNKPTTVSSYVGKDAAKPAEKKPKLDAKVLNSYVGKKMAEAAAVKIHQPGYNPPKQEHISSAEDLPSGEETALILGGKKSLDKIKEAAVKKPEPPFDPDPKPAKKVTAGKYGQGYSQAKHLARKGMQQMLQINPKIAEGWSDAALDQLEAVSYSGLGTDVVDKKKKLNPQPNLMMKPKQVKDFKEEALDEGKMKDIYTDMMDHATKKGYASHKEFTPKDYDTVGKLHGISGKELAVIAGHKTAAQATKEETVNELKASTLQSYADKAHQQAMDATYDAAHLNRTGEEKLKANAKKLAAKRAGGVQRAQTKLDKMSEEMTDQAPQQLAHGIGDVVQCTRTQRLASVISAEDEKYTVVYADGTTESGPADYWSAIRSVTEGRVIEQPRGWNVKHLKPAGHGIVGKKVRSYDFPGMHDSHYIEGHVTDEDPQSYHIRTTKVVRHNKEEPIANHHMHIRAPKGISLFGGAQGVYYAPKEMKPAAKKTLGSLRNKK